MKNILLFILMTSLVFAAEKNINVELNIAKKEYGAKSEAINVVDNDHNTASRVEKFTVKFATDTKLDKIDLKFVPANGKLVFKTKINNKEYVIHDANITEDDDYLSFILKDDNEYGEITVEWTPKDSREKLEVREFGAYISDKEMVTLYKQVAQFITKNITPESKISEVAGAETTTTTERNMIIPTKLPTEYVISPSRIYN